MLRVCVNDFMGADLTGWKPPHVSNLDEPGGMKSKFLDSLPHP